MRTVEIQVFKFKELSEPAKARAREWWRTADVFDGDCSEEEIIRTCKLLGMSEPCLRWSGFWSQGDGASISGWWHRDDLDLAKFREEHAGDYPFGQAVVAVAERLAKLPSGTSVRIGRETAHYCHENTLGIDAIEDGEGQDIYTSDLAQEILSEFRDLSRAAYKLLESEWEWTQSDDYADEAITANDYEFTVEGKLY